MSTISPYVGPLLALLGTLAVAGLGFYQWRRTAANQGRAAIAESRRKAAEAVWSKLEEANLALREGVGGSALLTLRKEVNATFLKNSLYLDDEAQRAVAKYVEALVHVGSLLKGDHSSMAEEWSNTAWPIASEGSEAAAALREVRRQRSHVKHILLEATGA
jgi:hypothetical protein